MANSQFTLTADQRAEYAAQISGSTWVQNQAKLYGATTIVNKPLFAESLAAERNVLNYGTPGTPDGDGTAVGVITAALYGPTSWIGSSVKLTALNFLLDSTGVNVAKYYKAVLESATLDNGALDATMTQPSNYINNFAVATAGGTLGTLFTRYVDIDSGWGLGDDLGGSLGGATKGSAATGTALTHANLLTLYSTTYGPTKFAAIFNPGVLKGVQAEPAATAYDTLTEVAALYSTWTLTSATADAPTFFNALAVINENAAAPVQFTQLAALTTANWNTYVSDNVVKLMTTSGATWAALIGYAAAKFNALTTAAAIQAVDKCGATMTGMATIYDASPLKLISITNADSINICDSATLTTAQLSTNYGTTYTPAADANYRTSVQYGGVCLKDGVTAAHVNSLRTQYDLSCICNKIHEGVAANSGSTADATATALISPAVGLFAGLEGTNACLI